MILWKFVFSWVTLEGLLLEIWLQHFFLDRVIQANNYLMNAQVLYLIMQIASNKTVQIGLIKMTGLKLDYKYNF